MQEIPWLSLLFPCTTQGIQRTTTLRHQYSANRCHLAGIRMGDWRLNGRSHSPCNHGNKSAIALLRVPESGSESWLLGKENSATCADPSKDMTPSRALASGIPTAGALKGQVSVSERTLSGQEEEGRATNPIGRFFGPNYPRSCCSALGH